MGIPGVPLDKDKILMAITLKRGVIEHVAKEVGCSPRAIYEWMHKDEDVRQAIEDERARAIRERVEAERKIVESAYSTIQSLIDSNDVTATIFALKTKAGWSEKSHQDHHIKIVHETYDKRDKAPAPIPPA